MPDDVSRRFGALLIELGLVTETQVQEALALQALNGHRIGESLLSLGHLTRAQLQRALSEALRRGAQMSLDKPPLGEILVGLKYLQPHELEQVLSEQRTDGRRLGEMLVGKGQVNHQQLYEALGLQQRMAARPDASVELRAPVPLAPTGVKVLVVDDSLLACNLVAEGLGLLGYEVHAFQDPFVALEQVDTVKPNIVLTDLDMPGIDGAELCRRLKNGPARAIPVVIITANDADVHRIQGLRAGADDYVSKGASMEEVGARIESILRRINETERVRRLFARYTSDAVVEEILNSGEVVLTGEKRECTILFADVRGFTTLSESLPAEQVMTLLNAVLGRLADVVLAHGGTLDKFLGDGLMAVFGAPVRRDDDAVRAVSAARDMLRAVTEHNEGDSGLPKLELGIGINTGQVVAGSLGSTRRTEYTCIGDAVNVASRLCSLAGPGEVLMGQLTVERVGDGLTCQALQPARLKGKTQPVPLFRLT